MICYDLKYWKLLHYSLHLYKYKYILITSAIKTCVYLCVGWLVTLLGFVYNNSLSFFSLFTTIDQ